jgi:cysteinyl-tRNA synthetase
MSKSKGNVLCLDDVARGIPPRAYRLFLLGAHYRQKLLFTWEALEAAHAAYRRLERSASDLPPASPSVPCPGAQRYLDEFGSALADDLNTSKALAVLFRMLKDDELAASDRRALLDGMDEALGLGLQAPAAPAGDSLVEGLVLEREQARAARDFARADAIRRELERRGIVIEDSPSGPVLRQSARAVAPSVRAVLPRRKIGM